MARNPFQWFPFYATDWLTDERVRIVSLQSQGAYMRLLSSQWVEGSIPDDDQSIARLLGIQLFEWMEFAHEVRQFFVESGDGRLVNIRLEKEREKQIRQHNRLSKAGKAGADVTNNSRNNNYISGHADERQTARPIARPPANERPGSGQLESESESDIDPESEVRQENVIPADAGALPATPDDLQWEWNLVAGEYKLPACRQLTTKRRKHATSRLRDNPDLSYWRTVINRIAESPFCRGETERGWRANFDWLIHPDTHVKVLEGKYDGQGVSKSQTRTIGNLGAANSFLGNEKLIEVGN